MLILTTFAAAADDVAAMPPDAATPYFLPIIFPRRCSFATSPLADFVDYAAMMRRPPMNMMR